MEAPALESFFVKLQAWDLDPIKKRLSDRCFPVNFGKCLRTYFLQKTSEWLLLNLFLFILLFFVTQWTNRTQFFSIFEHVYPGFQTWQISWILRLENFTLWNKQPGCWWSFLWEITWNLAVVFRLTDV